MDESCNKYTGLWLGPHDKYAGWWVSVVINKHRGVSPVISTWVNPVISTQVYGWSPMINTQDDRNKSQGDGLCPMTSTQGDG